MTDNHKTTDFGFETVPWHEKQKKVADVFDSVADKYDIMNDVMSLGIHRLWKTIAIRYATVKPHYHVLDLASGSGDLAKRIYPLIKEKGRLVISDINDNMLSVAKRRLTDNGMIASLDYVIANAEKLPFENNTFDLITIAFGLRNVTDKNKALKSMLNALKPGGKCLVLEFSTPTNPLLKSIYDAYSFCCVPTMGQWIANDKDSYQYLVESIRKHPPQDELKAMMAEAGFEDCIYHSLSGGIVSIHIGYKY
jgi:demethylmenaquinone methyltransferase/2-methoxy-6-polyprenyl-1,4-benzoquinol methylase